MKGLFSIAAMVLLGACAHTTSEPPSLGQQVYSACLAENDYQSWRQTLQGTRIHMQCKRLAGSYEEGFAQRLAQVEVKRPEAVD